MLKSLVARLGCPTCRDPDTILRLHIFEDGSDGHVKNGILKCGGCGTWYPIEEELLELVPWGLISTADATEFKNRFAPQLAAAGVDIPVSRARSEAAAYAEQMVQREHFDDFADGSLPDYTRTHFIQAASRRYIDIWRKKLPSQSVWILDVGCGTGLNSVPFADHHTVVGFDISKKVIRRDIEQAKAGDSNQRLTFLVADGSSMAFRDNSFDFVQTFGSLHHLPNPATAIKEIQRVLVPGGMHFAVENNHSMFRGIFDFMMKIRPLWIEEAGAEPLISRAMVDSWCDGLPVEIKSETSIFLPPHLINLLPQNAANWTLDMTDRFFSRVPGIGRHGGQLVFTIRSAPVQ